jgi:DNA primase
MDLKDLKAEIESAISISSLAGTRATRVQCPFHMSSDPDIALDHSNNTWRCYGSCDDGRWHTIYDWVMMRDGLDFATALKSLAEDAGISLSPNKERSRILADSQSYYYDQLQKHPEVLAYLYKRGFSDELIYQRQIGYAPLDFFPTNVTLRQLYEVGLMKTGYYKPYPFFSDRIVYPVYDWDYNMIQMQGRLVGSPEAPEGKYMPKYLALSTEVELKGRSIYQCLGGEDTLKREGLPYVFLCEGWPDRETLAAWRLNAVSLFGHSGMEKHANKLKRVKKVYVVLDPDEASQKRLLNGLYDLAIKIPEVEFFVVDLEKLTGGQDLNDWAMSGKPQGECLSPKYDEHKIEQLRNACAEAPTLAKALIERWASVHAHMIEPVARFVGKMPDKERWIAELAKALGQSTQSIQFLLHVLAPTV